jgi:dienelactone hydrolase
MTENITVATADGGVKPGVEISVYPGVGHGFIGKGRANYDENADTESNRAALALIEAM